MARENFYDVALKKSAVGEMTKDIFYGFDAAEWFLTEDDQAIMMLFELFKAHGFETGEEEGVCYAIFSDEGKMLWPKEKYDAFLDVILGMNIKDFATKSVDNLLFTICDSYRDAAWMNDCLYPFYQFIRKAKVGVKHYFGNTVVYAH